jgi:hypothetical protein
MSTLSAGAARVDVRFRQPSVLSAQHYRLALATVILVDVDGRAEAEFLPAGEIVTLLSKEQTGKFIAVSHEGRPARIFAVDLQERGMPLT